MPVENEIIILPSLLTAADNYERLGLVVETVLVKAHIAVVVVANSYEVENVLEVPIGAVNTPADT